MSHDGVTSGEIPTCPPCRYCTPSLELISCVVPANHEQPPCSSFHFRLQRNDRNSPDLNKRLCLSEREAEDPGCWEAKRPVVALTSWRTRSLTLFTSTSKRFLVLFVSALQHAPHAGERSSSCSSLNLQTKDTNVTCLFLNTFPCLHSTFSGVNLWEQSNSPMIQVCFSLVTHLEAHLNPHFLSNLLISFFFNEPLCSIK